MRIIANPAAIPIFTGFTPSSDRDWPPTNAPMPIIRTVTTTIRPQDPPCKESNPPTTMTAHPIEVRMVDTSGPSLGCSEAARRPEFCFCSCSTGSGSFVSSAAFALLKSPLMFSTHRTLAWIGYEPNPKEVGYPRGFQVTDPVRLLATLLPHLLH